MKNDFIAKQVKAVLSGVTMPTFNEATLPDKNEKRGQVPFSVFGAVLVLTPVSNFRGYAL